MKIKVELENNETPEQAEELLEKAVKKKIQSRKEYYSSERYYDEAIEDFHQLVTKEHQETLEQAIEEVQDALIRDIRGY